MVRIIRVEVTGWVLLERGSENRERLFGRWRDTEMRRRVRMINRYLNFWRGLKELRVADCNLILNITLLNSSYSPSILQPDS